MGFKNINVYCLKETECKLHSPGQKSDTLYVQSFIPTLCPQGFVVRQQCQATFATEGEQLLFAQPREDTCQENLTEVIQSVW